VAFCRVKCPSTPFHSVIHRHANLALPSAIVAGKTNGAFAGGIKKSWWCTCASVSLRSFHREKAMDAESAGVDPPSSTLVDSQENTLRSIGACIRNTFKRNA
jgi:hypothetical protein